MKKQQVWDELTPVRFATSIGSIGCRVCGKRHEFLPGNDMKLEFGSPEFLGWAKAHLAQCFNVDTEPGNAAERVVPVRSVSAEAAR